MYSNLLLFLLFNFSFESQILQVPLTIHHQDINKKYTFYFVNYTTPIALSFSYSYSYLRKTFLFQRYQSEENFSSSVGNNEYYITHDLFKEKMAFQGPNSNITFNYIFSTNSKDKLRTSFYDNYLTLRYSSKPNEKHIAIYLYKQKIIPYPKFGIFLEQSLLFFGGIPKTMNCHKVIEQKIPLSQLDNSIYFVHLSSFKMGNIFFDYNSSPYKLLISFQGTSLDIPIDSFEKIVNTYLKDDIANKNCFQEYLES